MKQVLFPLTLQVLLLSVSLSIFAQDNETADFSSLKINTTGADGNMLDFAVSHDQRYIVVANEKKVIKIYDGRTGRFIKNITGYHNTLMEIILSHDGERIITAGLDNSIAVIELKTGQLINTITVKNKLRCLVIDRQGKTAIAGDNKGFITFIDLETFTVRKELPSGSPQVSSLAFSPDFKQLAVGTGIAVGYMIKKYPILLVDVESKAISKNLEGLPGATTAIRYSYDGLSLYTGHKSNSRTLMKWNLATGESVIINQLFNILSLGGYTSIDVNRENTVIAATTDDQSIQIYDLAMNKQISNQFASKYRMVRKLDHFPRNVFGVNDGKNFIIGGFTRNLLYIYNAEKKGVVGYIHLFNNEWAVVAADGRMDGSYEAIKNLSWRSGFYTIPLENTFDTSFSPKLLSQLLLEDNAREEFKVEQSAKEIPELKIRSVDNKPLATSDATTPKIRTAQKNISIHVTAEKNAHQIDEIRLYQNTKLVNTVIAKPGQTLSTVELKATLTDAFGEENFFYVTAKSKQGLDAEKSKFIVEYEGKSDEKPKLFLITVGVNSYRNPKYNLNFAVADASAFEREVKKGGGNLFDQVIVKSIRDNKATKTDILAAFHEIQKQAKEQDLFIFYYAGHGVMSEGKVTEAQFYLVPHDITQLYGKDDVLTEKAISATELKELSKNINAQKQVFILDACQSSGAIDALTVRGAAEERALAQLARSTGTFWITATGTEQFATEFADLGHGVFTYSLLEGLRGKADNGDKRITIKELSAYIENRVPELSEKYKGTPQFPSGYSFGNDFPIVLVD
jgi:WD40 repeat protein